MPIGKDSVKRAVTAKKVAKPEFETTEYNMVEVSVADISYRAAKACPALVESVKENGVILPVVLIKDGDSLKLLDGAKRLNALKELKIPVVKAVVLNGDVKKIKAELKKCTPANCEAKPAAKPIEECKPLDVKEEKFELVKRLGEDDFPVYLL